MPLPDFLMLGVAKSGTTSLCHALKQHLDFFLPTHKEPRFFGQSHEPQVTP